MNINISPRQFVVVLAAVALALTGCSSAADTATTPNQPPAVEKAAPSTSSTTESVPTTSADAPYPGVDQAVIDRTFVEGAREVAGLWEFTDDQLVQIAHDICRGFDKDASLGKLTQILVDNLLISPRNAAALVGTTIPAYCPEHHNEIAESEAP